MLLSYTYALTAVVRNTPVAFRVFAKFLPALYNVASLVGSVSATVIGKVHLERQDMCRPAHLLVALCVEERE